MERLGTTFAPGLSNRATMRFLRLADVRNRVPFGRATIYRLIKSGGFPKPYSLGARAVAWLESDVDAWIEARVTASADSALQGATNRGLPDSSNLQALGSCTGCKNASVD